MLQEKFEVYADTPNFSSSHRICIHLRAERTRVYRATATYPYGVPDMLNTSNPVWVQLRDNINSALQRAMRASEVPPNTTTL
ncbi:hypothetical protein WJX77_005492 [Trebouxia sp. C0004]